MKNARPLLWLTAILAACLALGCGIFNGKADEETIAPPGLPGAVSFRVFANNKLLPGATVKLVEGQAVTDENGLCSIPGMKKEVGEERRVLVIHPGYQIDTAFLVKIRPVTELAVLVYEGGADMLGGQAAGRKSNLLDIQDKLEQAENMLDRIEGELEQYLRENPESAMGDYQEVVAQRRQELAFLRGRSRSLLERYEEVIRDLDAGAIVNIKEHEGDFLELEEHFNDFMSKAHASSYAFDSNKQARPDIEEDTDIFFGEGEYRLRELTEHQRARLDAFVAKIRELERKYAGFEKQELRLRLIAVGFTDGVPVGQSLSAEIAYQCRQDGFQYRDPNSCLSFLRAREMVNYISRQVEDLAPLPVADGQGSLLANGSTRPDPGLRKCHLSFSLMERQIIDSPSPR